MERRMRALLRATIAFIFALFAMLIAAVIIDIDWLANVTLTLMVGFIAVSIPSATAVAGAYDLGSAMQPTPQRRRLLITYTHIAVVGAAILAGLLAIWAGRLLEASWAASAIPDDVWSLISRIGGIEGRNYVVVVPLIALTTPYAALRMRGRQTTQEAAISEAGARRSGFDAIAVKVCPLLEMVRAHFSRATFVYLVLALAALVVALVSRMASTAVIVCVCWACVISSLCVQAVCRLARSPVGDSGQDAR